MVKISIDWSRKGKGQPPDDYGDHFYLHEIESQCEFGIRSFGEMQQIVKSDPQNKSLIALSHMLLVFAGNVSKMLTASKDSTPKKRARAKRLSNLLGFTAYDFSDVQRARNFFEHFDERIDRFIHNTDGLLMHRLILDHEPPKISFDDGRQFSPNYLQFLNTQSGELMLYGERYSLPKIVQLLNNVQSKAQLCIREMTKTKDSKPT